MTDSRIQLLDEMGFPHSPEDVDDEEVKDKIEKILSLDSLSAGKALGELRITGRTTLPAY